MEYFLHIPKTAGTSLTRFLDQYYQHQDIFPHQSWDKVLENWPVDVSNFKLARGHFGYCAHHLFGFDNLNYITILRNPVERTISQFHHMTVDRDKNNWVYKFPYTSIQPMLYQSPWVVSNIQVKYLSFDENVLTIENLNNPDRFIFLENYEPTNMEELFQKACANLDKFFFVGLFEKIAESVDRLCEKMNWERRELKRENVLKNRPAIKNFRKRAISRIEELNEWDFKLYDYVKEKFFK